MCMCQLSISCHPPFLLSHLYYAKVMRSSDVCVSFSFRNLESTAFELLAKVIPHKMSYSSHFDLDVFSVSSTVQRENDKRHFTVFSFCAEKWYYSPFFKADILSVGPCCLGLRDKVNEQAGIRGHSFILLVWELMPGHSISKPLSFVLISGAQHGYI